jgi:hypothetical protein
VSETSSVTASELAAHAKHVRAILDRHESRLFEDLAAYASGHDLTLTDVELLLDGDLHETDLAEKFGNWAEED